LQALKKLFNWVFVRVDAACGMLIKLGKMDLFSNSIDETTNLLPKDGVVNYFGKLLSRKVSDHYFDRLLEDIRWKNDEAIILGKHIITKRKVAWYGDSNYAYTYSNVTKQALNWTQELLELKTLVEERTEVAFNSCLLNLYHTGDEGMAWHSDDEKSLGVNTTIASLSFGAERKFAFKHKRTGEKVGLVLESGSLLVMKGATQTHWLHRLPPAKLISKPRINLTFRTIVDQPIH
jgi:alkylated DNA repair dioxygenase AlkB